MPTNIDQLFEQWVKENPDQKWDVPKLFARFVLEKTNKNFEAAYVAFGKFCQAIDKKGPTKSQDTELEVYRKEFTDSMTRFYENPFARVKPQPLRITRGYCW